MQDKSKLFWRLTAIAVVVFFILAGVYFLYASTSDSKRLEQQLIDRYGQAEDYVPVADGNIQAERIESFIRVREAVQTSCNDFQEVLNGLIGLAKLESEDDVSGNEAASAGIRGFKSMINAGPRMLAFMDSRNTALLEEQMGIGEYLYLYLAAYGEQLANAATSAYAEMEEAYISDRTRKEYLQILHNQLDAIEAVPGDSRLEPLKSQLAAEIHALEEGTQSAPWPSGPPGTTAISIAPFSDRIYELYCEGIVYIELLQKNRGFLPGG